MVNTGTRRACSSSARKGRTRVLFRPQGRIPVHKLEVEANTPVQKVQEGNLTIGVMEQDLNSQRKSCSSAVVCKIKDKNKRRNLVLILAMTEND